MYKAKAISKKTGQVVDGYISWNENRNNYYLITPSAEKENGIPYLNKEEVFRASIVLDIGEREQYIFQGKSRKSLSYVQGYFFMDKDERCAYIGYFGETGEEMIEEVFPYTSGIYTGRIDIYGQPVFCNQEIVIHSPFLKRLGKIVLYRDYFYFKNDRDILKPLYTVGKMEALA